MTNNDRGRPRGWLLGALVAGVLALAAVGAGSAVALHDDEAHQHDDGSHTDDHGLTTHDSTGGRAATEEDEANADAFVDAVIAGIAEYADLDVAIADGYVESADSADRTLKHYMTRGVDGAALDPEQPSGLMYYVDDDQATLLGAVWTTRDEEPPQPGGPLTVWHDHAAQGCPDAHPDCPAADGGDPGPNVPKMLHVWTFDGVEARFAHDIMGALGGEGTRSSGRDAKPRLPFDVRQS